jgi:hypothetical protein
VQKAVLMRDALQVQRDAHAEARLGHVRQARGDSPALPQLRDPQLQRAEPGVEGPVAVAIAPGRALAAALADLPLPSAVRFGVRFSRDSLPEEAGFELLVPLPSRTCAEPYRPALTLRKPEDKTRKSGRALSILRTEVALSAVVPAPFHVPL